MRRGIAVLVGLILWTWNGAAAEAPIPDYPMPQAGLSILRGIADPNGILDQLKYEMFWSQMPAEIRNSGEDRARLSTFVEMETRAANRFQRELWTSVKLSLATKQVNTTEGYGTLKQSLGKDQADAFAIGDQLIQAAASGKTLHAKGVGISIQPERVESILAGLDEAQDRVRRLMAPAWNGPSLMVRRYDDAFFRLRSTDVYKRHAGTVPIKGMPRSMVLYNGAETEMRAPFVGYIHQNVPLDTDTAKAVAGLLFNIGTYNLYGGAVDWRGRETVEISSGDRIGKGQAHHSIRVVSDPSLKGVWIIAASSRRSLPAAKALRAYVEENLQLD